MQNLWPKLEKFVVNKGNEKLSFIQRLANENDWSTEYTNRVYKEYLKFIYLAATSKTQVTPSDEVDQAWHLHLCYSNSYWNDLCRDILGRELHHGPTKGGSKERERFHSQYEQTLKLYELTFNENPPEDIWPPTENRFDNENRFIRVNLKDSIVIPKKFVYLGTAIIAAVFFLSSCVDYVKQAFDGDMDKIFTLIFIAAFIIILLIRRSGRGGGSGCGGGGGCSGCGGCGGGCGGG